MGVVRTRVGYTGGTTDNPTYRKMGDHSESIDIEYDQTVVSYDELLEIFWKNHSPTSRSSRQYMSGIFCHTKEQMEAAEKSKKEQQKYLAQPITTEIALAKTFYNAEDYHQKYMLRQQRPLLNSLGLSDTELISSHVASRLNGYAGGHGTIDVLNKEWSELGLSREQTDMVRRKISRSH